jgi:hypothetical protein
MERDAPRRASINRRLQLGSLKKVTSHDELLPDLNPIEEALVKIDHILRKIGAHTRDALIVFERCGHRRSTLPL